jgi:hypothetical protein
VGVEVTHNDGIHPRTRPRTRLPSVAYSTKIPVSKRINITLASGTDLTRIEPEERDWAWQAWREADGYGNVRGDQRGMAWQERAGLPEKDGHAESSWAWQAGKGRKLTGLEELGMAGMEKQVGTGIKRTGTERSGRAWQDRTVKVGASRTGQVQNCRLGWDRPGQGGKACMDRARKSRQGQDRFGIARYGQAMQARMVR